MLTEIISTIRAIYIEPSSKLKLIFIINPIGRQAVEQLARYKVVVDSILLTSQLTSSITSSATTSRITSSTTSISTYAFLNLRALSYAQDYSTILLLVIPYCYISNIAITILRNSINYGGGHYSSYTTSRTGSITIATIVDVKVVKVVVSRAR